MTIVQSSSAFAITKESVALAALAVRKPTNLTRLMGAAPKQAGAEAVIKQQSSPGLPGIMVRDLEQSAGDKVTMEAVDIVGGYPIMGDQVREGKGKAMGLATMEGKIDLASFVVDGGARMSQKRTIHRLRGLAMAQCMGYFPRLLWQRALVHMAGARGVQADKSWCIPLASHADFAATMINSVKAPTYNRHLVIDGANLIQGGAQLASIDTTDGWKLSHIDELAAWHDGQSFKLQPVRIPGDPAADDEPILGILMMDPQAWTQILTDTTSGHNIRNWQALAMARADLSPGGAARHPLFRGEFYLWNRILIRKMDTGIQFNASDAVPHITSANKLTATETNVTVNAALSTTHRASRSLLLGAQGFACCVGANESTGIEAAFKERRWDYDSKYEAMGEWMGGEFKTRFTFINDDGNGEPTDHGIVAIDAAVKRIG